LIKSASGKWQRVYFVPGDLESQSTIHTNAVLRRHQNVVLVDNGLHEVMDGLLVTDTLPKRAPQGHVLVLSAKHVCAPNDMPNVTVLCPNTDGCNCASISQVGKHVVPIAVPHPPHRLQSGWVHITALCYQPNGEGCRNCGYPHATAACPMHLPDKAPAIL